MFTQDPPKLKVLLGNGYLDIEDAVKRDHDFVLETLISAFLLLPLSPHTLTRLQLGDCFRRSLQSSRQTTPYRLHTIVTECKAGSVDTASLEAKFFEHGGVRAVTALAAAAADNKQIVRLLKGLSNAEFHAFLKYIDAIEPHRDLLYIIETLERKRPSKLSKRKHVPGPRPPRPRPRPPGHNSHIPGSIPQDLGRFQMVNDHSIHNLPPTSHPHRLNGTEAHLIKFSTVGKTQRGGTSITADIEQTEENMPASRINTSVAVAFQQNDGGENHTFPQGKSSCPLFVMVAYHLNNLDKNTFPNIASDLTGDWQCDGRIDLDNLHNTPRYGIDAENPSFEHYAIDLENFNAL